jgi:copper chaperone NosL
MNLTATIGRSAALVAVILLLAGCGEQQQTVQPREITRSAACSLDGMILADYPGPKGQIHYAGGDIDYFCETMELMSIYLRPEQKKRVVGIFTQDIAQTNWKRPEGHWIDARSAFFVHGSRMDGSMGPTWPPLPGRRTPRRSRASTAGACCGSRRSRPNSCSSTAAW